MPIKLTDELVSKTKKGKVASAKQVFLEGDKKNLQQVGEQTEQLKELVDAISVSGGASIASAVTYDNKDSGLTSVTAQGAITELAKKNKEQDTTLESKANKADVKEDLAKKIDKTSIQSVLADNEDMVPSLKLTKDELDKKVDNTTYKEKVASLEETLGTKANTEKVEEELAKKFDKANIAQELDNTTEETQEGDSTEDADTVVVSDEERVPSLKLVRDSLNTKANDTDVTTGLDAKIDKASISSELGEGGDKVPSLSLVSTELAKKFNKENIDTEAISEDASKVPSSALVKTALDTNAANIGKVEGAVNALPKFRQMTLADYEALESKEDNIYYMCTEE